MFFEIWCVSIVIASRTELVEIRTSFRHVMFADLFHTSKGRIRQSHKHEKNLFIPYIYEGETVL